MSAFIAHYYQFIIAGALLSFGLAYGIKTYLIRKKIYPAPRPRDVHKRPIPRLGGIALYASFWLMALFVHWYDATLLRFGNVEYWGLDSALVGLFLASTLILAVGVYDDLKSMPWQLKLTGQVAAALLAVAFGIKIEWLSNPFGDPIELGMISAVFAVCWLVLIMNTLNWLDGLDGLASGVTAIGAFILGILAISLGATQLPTATLAAILLAVLLGFLVLNFNPAKIFLGDSGSLFIGFVIGVIAIISGGKVATAALVLGLPILDVIWVVARRIKQGHSPFLADRQHLHHRLLQAGLTVRQSVIFLYCVSFAFGVIALRSQTESKFQAAVALVVLLLVLAAVLVYGPRYKLGKKGE